MNQRTDSIPELADRVERRLVIPEARTAWPALVLLTGLPGTGKSHLSRQLALKLTFAIVETDAIRKALIFRPTYDNRESRLVYEVCHEVIARLLAGGIRVIFDATNLGEAHREVLYRIAEKTGARLVVVRVVASEEVLQERLATRQQGANKEDKSDADWGIYKRMQASEEPILRQHLVVNTELPLEPALQKVLRAVRPPG